MLSRMLGIDLVQDYQLNSCLLLKYQEIAWNSLKKSELYQVLKIIQKISSRNVYIQIRSDKMLLLAWLCTDADAVSEDSCKSLWVFMYIAEANLLSFLYKLLYVTIFKHIWLPSVLYACFFIVFGWHPWSSCTFKIKKSLCVAQFTCSHCYSCTMLHKSLWHGHNIAVLSLFLKAE